MARPLERLSQLTLPRSDLCFPSAPSLFSFRQTGAMADESLLAHPPARFESPQILTTAGGAAGEASPSPLPPFFFLLCLNNNNSLK